MAMDAETKSVLDTLLGGTGGYHKKKPRESFTTYKPKPCEHFEVPKPKTYCYNINEDSMMLKEQSATLSVDPASASIVLKAVMNSTVLELIQANIPLTMRDWDDRLRVWRFSPAALPMLKPLLKDLYKDIVMLGVPKALPSTKFDQLMTQLDKDDKAAIYRLLASKYHPDKGGSHTVMTLINIVFRGS